ncbi:MAG: gamma-glutamyltransferase [Streptomycetales bacterium]
MLPNGTASRLGGVSGLPLAHASGGTHDTTCYGGLSSSSHPRATAAGADMLMRGGNAVDAAIATAFALAVCEPAMSHLGGQGNMLVHLAAERRTVALDFYACAPGAARPEMYRWLESPTQGDYRFWTEGDRNTTGALAVGIPGNVCGWVTAHQRWGSLPLPVVVAPAARAAREGVPLTSRMTAFVAEYRDALTRFPGTAGLFLRRDGEPKRESEIIVQPQLADTIELIGADGYESFYGGEIARAIVAHLGADGGVLSRDDLARYPEKLMWVREPDRVSFKGHTILGATPSSSALLLHLLKLLDGIDFRGFAPLSADQLHLLIEAMKLAFADRLLHIGDHTQVNVPLEGLLSAEYAARRRALIRHDRASSFRPGDPWTYQRARPDTTKLTATTGEAPGHECGTTHHSHVDRNGNFVSLTQSLGDPFGSGITVPGYGFLLNNAMKLFDPRPGDRPAGISPYRRPLTPWPTLVCEGETAVLALGSPSGTRIPNTLAQALVNVLDHGMGLQAATDLPRVHWSGHEFEAESDLPEPVKRELAARGHDVQYRAAGSPWFGAVQAVGRDPRSGLCHGAADARREGAVAGVTMAG